MVPHLSEYSQTSDLGLLGTAAYRDFWCMPNCGDDDIRQKKRETWVRECDTVRVRVRNGVALVKLRRD
jgi:hypothetical protein